MKFASTAYEFDVSKMADEALVVLARECPHLGAREDLVLRHFSRAAFYIAALARNTGLGREDTEEAQQNAEFGIEEAIDHYDLGQLARKHGKTFRQYLRQVVWSLQGISLAISLGFHFFGKVGIPGLKQLKIPRDEKVNAHLASCRGEIEPHLILRNQESRIGHQESGIRLIPDAPDP